MEYIFGVDRVDGQMIENLKTVGKQHSDLTGFVETRRVYDDCIICDRFRVIEKYDSMENSEQKYDLYHIADHYRYSEQPFSNKVLQEQFEAALCEIDEANEAAHAVYETALCDIDELLNGGTSNE